VQPVADSLEAEGRAAFDEANWTTAYRRLSSALQLDPSRAWVRRLAETTRAKRLGFDPETKAAQEAERDQRRKDLAERAKQRQLERDENDANQTGPTLPQRKEAE
jgi:hypothetical protein